MDLILCSISGVTLISIATYFLRLSRSASEFPELRTDTHQRDEETFPKISVILAVKDEEDHVEGCVRSLFSLSYPKLEVVVVNDRSSDRTADKLSVLSVEYGDRLKIKTITEVPDGWGGQNHAFWRGVDVSTGAWLCFTDADCRFDAPNVLEQAYLEAIAHHVPFLSMLPRMDVPSLTEKIYVPICSFLFLQGLGYSETNNPQSEHASAYGPFMLMSRDAYIKMGGHERVRFVINGDIALGRIAKSEGIGFRLVGNLGLCRTHMYQGLWASWSGWTRNFYNSIQSPKRLLIIFALGLGFSLPPCLLISSLMVGEMPSLMVSATLNLFMLVALSKLYAVFDLSPWLALISWPGALWSTLIAGGALYKAALRQDTLWHGVNYPHPCRIPPKVKRP